MHANRQLSILAPTRYPWRFNGPRTSRHSIHNRNFVPFNYLSSRFEGATIFNPLPFRSFDLAHAFNRIPLGTLPYVIGLESHLPRAFGHEDSIVWRTLTRLLTSKRCRGIVAISEFARRNFLAQHRDETPELSDKLHVRYPNIKIPTTGDAFDPTNDGPIRVVFTGNHFARKGGCVAVMLAELAQARGVPLIVDIVSKLEVGGTIWTDPTDPAVYRPYLDRLTLPNVHVHQDLPNDAVLNLMRKAHFTLLPTFGDTFGFTVIESMANHTPVIATRQGALPEIISHMQDGILLDLPVTVLGEWVHLGRSDRHSTQFVHVWRDEVQRLAESTLDGIVQATTDRTAFANMRRAARASAMRFDADQANIYWDQFYEAAVDGVVRAARCRE